MRYLIIASKAIASSISLVYHQALETISMLVLMRQQQDAVRIRRYCTLGQTDRIDLVDLDIGLIAGCTDPGGLTTPTRPNVGHDIRKAMPMPRLCSVGGIILARLLLLLLLIAPPVHAQLSLLKSSESVNLAFFGEDNGVVAASGDLYCNARDLDLNGASVCNDVSNT